MQKEQNWRHRVLSAPKRLFRKITGGWRTYHEAPIEAEVLDQQMQAAAVPSGGFFLMLALSAVIATIGLIANSAPAIIGAMIIAPLMTPIVSAAYGLACSNRKLVSLSITSIIAGAALVIGISFLGVHIFSVRIAGGEILARTSPTMLDLGVALAAGCAGAFAQTRPSIANSIAGVAIAVALVPPLAVTGIGLALGHKATTETGLSLSEFGLYSGGSDIAAGSFILFLTNLIGIVIVAALVFTIQGYGKWKQSLASVAIILFASAFLVPPLSQALHEVYVKNRVARLHSVRQGYFAENFTGSAVKIDKIDVAYREGILHVNVDMFATRSKIGNGQERVDAFRERLARELGEPVVVEVDIVPIEFIQLRSVPPELAERLSD